VEVGRVGGTFQGIKDLEGKRQGWGSKKHRGDIKAMKISDYVRWALTIVISVLIAYYEWFWPCFVIMVIQFVSSEILSIVRRNNMETERKMLDDILAIKQKYENRN